MKSMPVFLESLSAGIGVSSKLSEQLNFFSLLVMNSKSSMLSSN